MTRRLLVFFLLMSMAVVGRSMAQHLDQLPAPIMAFYQDRNFVSLFSTRVERVTIAKYARLPEEEQTQKPLSKRLQTIAPKLARIERHVFDVDPRMNIPRRRKGEPNPGYDGIVEVKEFRDFKSGLAVRVTACEVDPKGRAVLVSMYERAGGDERGLPPLEERLRLGRGRICRDEIHYWSVAAGEWVTQTARTVFLDETAR